MGARFDRSALLAFSALAGDPYADSCAAFAEREGTPAEESALRGHFSHARGHHSRDPERRIRAYQRCGLGLGRLSPVFPALLQGRRSSAGDDLPERAERPLVLLPSHFLPRARRDYLDNVE